MKVHVCNFIGGPARRVPGFTHVDASINGLVPVPETDRSSLQDVFGLEMVEHVAIKELAVDV